MDQKKTSEAEQLFREVIQTGGPAMGAGPPTVLSATRKLAGILLEQKRYAESVELLSAAEPLARKAYTGPNERSVATLLKTLGGARSQMRQFPAAETNLLEAHAIYAKTRGESHADTRTCMQSIVDFYSLWSEAEPGQDHGAASSEWKKKLESMPQPVPEKKP